MSLERNNKLIVIASQISLSYDKDICEIDEDYFSWDEMPFSNNWNFLIYAWSLFIKRADLDKSEILHFNEIVNKNKIYTAFDYFAGLADIHVSNRSLKLP